MSSDRKKYTLFYRIYRRIRYLRYVRRLRRVEKKHARVSLLEESRNRKKLIREQKNFERKAERARQKAEKKKLKNDRLQQEAELKEDLQQNAERYSAEHAERRQKKRKARYYRKRKRLKLLRLYRKVCRRNTLDFIRSLHPSNLPLLIRQIKESKSAVKQFFVISLHSSLLFVAAYLLVFLIGLFTSAVSGLFFDFKSIIYYYDVFWLVKSDQWYSDSVKMIFASRPIVSGLFAIFLSIIFSNIKTDRGLFKLFILWAMIHAYNAFFGSLLVGSIFGKGFGYAISWAYISDTEKVIYSIISILVLFLVGVFTTKSFLVSANSYYSKLEGRKQRFFIWAQVILPYFLGNAIIGAVMYPQVLFNDIAISIALLIVVLPIALGYRFYPSMYFEEENIRVNFKYRLLLYTISFTLLYRLILGIGIPLG